MADPNFKINVSAENKAGRTFQEIKQDLDRVKAELAKPIPIGPLTRDDSKIRDMLQGRAKGLERSADQTRLREEADRRVNGDPGSSIDRRAFGIADRTPLEQSRRDRRAREIRNERATSGIQEEADALMKRREAAREAEKVGSGAAGKGIDALKDKYAKLAVTAAAVGIALKAANAVVDLGSAIFADSQGNAKKAAEGYIAFSEAVGKIPIVGQFALNIANKLSGGALEAAKKALADAEEIDKRTEEMKAKARERRGEGDKKIGDSAASARAAQDALSTVGLSGDAAARAQAAAELRKTEADLDRRLADTKDPKLAQDQREKIEKNIAAERLAARQKFALQTNEIDRKQFTEEREAMRQHKEAMAQGEAALNQELLESQGRFLEARLAAIQEARRKAVEEANKQAGDELKSLGENGVSGNDPRWKAVEDRRKERVAQADAKAGADAAKARQDDTVDRVKDAEQAEDRITKARTEAAVTRLQISGRALEAEKLQREEAYREQLEQIKQNFEEQIRAHKEREPELRKQLGEELDAAKQAHDASEEQAAARLERLGRVQGPTPFSGDSRLLTGVGSTADPMLAPTQISAKANEETQKNTAAVKEGVTKMVNLLDQIARGGGFVVTAAPD